MDQQPTDAMRPAAASVPQPAAPPDFHLPAYGAQDGGLDFILPPVEGMDDNTGPASEPPRPSRLKQWEARGGVLGTLATGLLLLVKAAGPILKAAPFLPKLFVTGGSMLLSIWLEAMVLGWPFAAGIVLLIFVHECGHAFAARQRGMPFSFMLFIPFMGAMVAHKRGGRSVVEDAYIGIMGPVFGTLGGIVCVLLFLATSERFWIVLAQVNFSLNLFNLLPSAPLDGGWIVPVFSPKILALGLAMLVLLVPHNPLLWILVLLSLPRIIGHWRSRPDHPYFRVTSGDRWRYGIAYLGLVGVLAYANVAIHRTYPRRPLGTVRLAAEQAPSRPRTAEQDSR